MSAKYQGTAKELPPKGGGSIWKPLLPKWRAELVDDEGDTFYHQYAPAGSSTASNLKRDYGVEAEAITVTGEDGQKVLTLFVRYPSKVVDGQRVVDEDRVKEIKAGFKQSKKTTPATGNGETENTPEGRSGDTPAASGGGSRRGR